MSLMRFFRLCVAASASFCFAGALVAWQDRSPAPPASARARSGGPPPADPAIVARGKAAFKSNCGFCHGDDGTGLRAPDLIRSVTLSHDEHGSLIKPIVRNGRQEKGMPSFASLPEAQIDDIVVFLHDQADAFRHSRRLPTDYAAKLRTGNAQAGKTYFEGAGQCVQCHSITKDLAGIASRFAPVDLQQQMVYPSRKKIMPMATVTLANGERYEGVVKAQDEFNIGITGNDGWYRSWPKDQVKVELNDPLQKHRDLIAQYADVDIHNLFAYLETLK